MPLFAADTAYSGCVDQLNQIAQTAEISLSDGTNPPLGLLIGGGWEHDFFLPPEIFRWQLHVRFVCEGWIYIHAVISGDDNILDYSVLLFDARGVSEEEHETFLEESRNAALAWEFTAPEIDEPGTELPPHVHRGGQRELREYLPLGTPITPQIVGEVLRTASRVAPAQDAYWHTLELVPR